MAINFARLITFGLLFFCSRAPATTSFAEGLGGCEAVLDFPKSELPPGFGLSKKDINEATNLSQVTSLAMAIDEAVRFLATLEPDGFYAVTSDYLEIQARLGKHIQIHNIAARQFPKDFYTSYFAAKDVSEEVVAAQFKRLSIHFSEAGLSDEALLVLAFAARSFFSMAIHRNLETQQIQRVTENFIRKAHAASYLPIFRDFFTPDPLFVAYAEYVRRSAMRSQGLPYEENNFRLKLTHVLAQAGAVSLEVKVRIALDLMDQPYRSTAQQSGFAWLLASGSNIKKVDKWLNAGSPFLTYRILRVLEELHGKHFNSEEDPYKFALKVLMDFLSDNPNTREYKFMSYALHSIWMEIARIQTIDPRMFHHKMKSEIFNLSLKVRTALKENQRQKEQMRHQDQAEQAKSSISVIPFKRKGEREFFVGSNSSKSGRAARRARLREQGTLLTATAVIPTRLDGALPISEIQVEGVLVHPDRPYYFEKFQSSFGARDDGLVVENVQYIRLTEALLSELRRKQQQLTPWIRHFLAGTTSSLGANGIKRLKSGNTLLWEIKSNTTGYRIIVQQDKATRVWTWLALVPHDKVDEYRMNHQL